MRGIVVSLNGNLVPTSSYNMIIEYLQLWNRATNVEYKKLQNKQKQAKRNMNAFKMPLASSRIESMKKAPMSAMQAFASHLM